MTYCAALRLDKGLVFMSDTRTNAGIDNISRFRKMFTWSVPGERAYTLMTAGNLATTQSLISVLNERSKVPEHRNPSVLKTQTLFQTARLIGETLREIVKDQASNGPLAASAFSATLIFGGQIKGMAPSLFLIYPEGNFVEASDETPFFQTGETMYGRPIILRAFEPGMSFEDAVRLLCVSFDSTLKANLSVGMPLDLNLYYADSFRGRKVLRIEETDPAFKAISDGWGDALKSAFALLPKYPI